ncbi:MAG: CDP-glycerol glycerophosphotransferase family protein [Nitriliruptoraceae bacterium]|nr:CDP-glycerol glycerophosphotransferase family protein [Nitriliruptoraceae bacterium]
MTESPAAETTPSPATVPPTGPLDRIGQVFHPAYLTLALGGLLLQLLGLALGSVVVAVIGLVVGAGADAATSNERHPRRSQLRRAGLGIVQRGSIRALLLFGAIAQQSELGAEPIWYPIAVVAVIASARAYQLVCTRLLREQPALGVRNIADDLELTWVFDRVRRRRTLGVALFIALEIPLALAVAWSLAGQQLGAVGIAGGLVLTAFGAVCIAALRVRRFVTDRRAEAYTAQLRDRIAGHGADVLVYFTGDADATYQLNQWVDVIDRLEQPVMFVIRERVHERAMRPTRWPVVVSPKHADVEVALAADPKVVLYVANAGRNIHFLRYARPRHVFLNHGDSDKISSANPVVKCYDRLFVAGELAIERYRAAGVNLPDDRFAIVGRPQLDGVLTDRRRIGDGPTTVLYAPTWEGYFDAADYSSLERQGLTLVERILANDLGVRLVFKPHPLSGLVRPAAARAVRRIEELIRASGAPHTVASDQPEFDLLDWFDRSDVLLSDISAVVTDFLHTGKPYLVTNPRSLSRSQFDASFPSHTAAYVLTGALDDLEENLAAAVGTDPLAKARQRTAVRVLGVHPHGPFESFTNAINAEIAVSEVHGRGVLNTFSYE